MSQIMIRCPRTGKGISTGISTDARSFQALPDVASHSYCPDCRSDHVWWKRETWLGQDALNGGSEDASVETQSAIGQGINGARHPAVR
jgi:hypothetical protein